MSKQRWAEEGELRCAHSGCVMLATEVVIDPGDRPRLSCRTHSVANAYTKEALSPEGLSDGLLKTWLQEEMKLQAKIRSAAKELVRRGMESDARELALKAALDRQPDLFSEEAP